MSVCTDTDKVHLSRAIELARRGLGAVKPNPVVGAVVARDGETLGEGWRADRYLLYEHSGGKNYTLVARTRWASAEAALTFFRDYQTILTHKYPELTAAKGSAQDLFIGAAANGQTLLLRQGDECRWAEGVAATQADAMLAWLRTL